MINTKQQIAEAALEALKTLGFAGATSRAIARLGGVNQALVFYHFGTVENALVAALDLTSEARLERYRTAIAEAATPQQLVRAVRRLYAEDVASGHVGVVAQMVAGSLNRPELSQQVLARIEPWVELGADVLRRFGAPDDLAYGLVTFALGANLLTHLDDGARADALFARLEQLVSGG